MIAALFVEPAPKAAAVEQVEGEAVVLEEAA